MFERKLYNAGVTGEPSPLSDKITSYVPLVSPPSIVQGLEEKNDPIQNSSMICNPSVETVGLENGNYDTGTVIRKSSRVSKKPVRLIEQV